MATATLNGVRLFYELHGAGAKVQGTFSTRVCDKGIGGAWMGFVGWLVTVMD